MTDDHSHERKATEKHTKVRMYKKFPRRKMNEDEQEYCKVEMKPLWGSKNKD